MRTKLTLITILFFFGFQSFAQLNLPEDENLAAQAKSNYVLLTDNMKSNDYEGSRQAIQWLVTNTPDLHESMYIHAIKVYNALAEKASGDKKNTLQDSVMMFYDLRIKHFNDEKNVTDRKATDAYQFYKKRGDKYTYLLEVFDKTYALNGTDVNLSNLASYMDVVSKNDSVNSMTKEEVLKRYYQVMAAIDKRSGEEDLDKVRGVATNFLVKTLGDSFDCNFIKEELAPELKNDPKVAKTIITLSLSQGCTQEDYFAEAAKILIKENPDYGLIRLVASKEVENENYDVAMDYYEKALAGTGDKEKKAKVTVDIAKLYQIKNDYVKSREYAEKALEFDPKSQKAYKLIGDLYFNSFEKCRGNQNIVNDRAVFLLAYDLYEKAGDTESMKNAREQFPSIGEIFERDYKEGESFKVACWINRSTTLRRRPE